MKARRVDFYPADWLNGTVELNAPQRGLYITACALMYERGGPISEELLRRWANCHGNQFRACLKRLESLGKLIRIGSDLTQKRVEYEREMAQKRVEIASENAKKRWNTNGPANANAHAGQQMPKHASRRATSSSSSSKKPSPLSPPSITRARDADTAARPPSPARRNGALSGAPPPPVRVDPDTKAMLLENASVEETGFKRFRIPSHFEGCQCPSCSQADQ